MRIVLTNAGKKEIIIEEAEKNNNNKIINHSVEKVKYSPKVIIPQEKQKKSSEKSSSVIPKKNHVPSYINTEENIHLAKPDKQLKKSLTLKSNKFLDYNNDNINNIKFINIKSSKKAISKELNDIYSIKESPEKIYDIKNKNNKIEYNHLNNDFSLPIIKNSLPLKDILSERNTKNINKTTLNKQINKNENNLINYLKLNKTIKPSFIEKLNKADNDRLVNIFYFINIFIYFLRIKLDKICQKYFNDKKRSDIIQQKIQDKIKSDYSNDSKYCRDNLITMKRNIQSYKNIYKSYFSSHRLKSLK